MRVFVFEGSATECQRTVDVARAVINPSAEDQQQQASERASEQARCMRGCECVRTRSVIQHFLPPPIRRIMVAACELWLILFRGHWAQYLSPAGETFYKNVLTGEVQWQKPGNFDCNPSRRAGEMTPGPGEVSMFVVH